MSKDFYLPEHALAGYVEKDWSDYILKSSPHYYSFDFAPFELQNLYSDYHEQLIQFLNLTLQKKKLVPKSALEVGSSLGRTFFEVCRQIPSIEKVTLVEPSKNLFETSQKIFKGDEVVRLPVLKGIGEFVEVELQTRAIHEVCVRVASSFLNKSFQEVGTHLGPFDLTICSNVIDQCKDPVQLVEFLKKSTAPTGVMLLSCTYQWNDKYIGNASDPAKDINEFFDSSWAFLAETNLPFRVRVNERYWMSFLSHVVAYQLK